MQLLSKDVGHFYFPKITKWFLAANLSYASLSHAITDLISNTVNFYYVLELHLNKNILYLIFVSIFFQ